jgi:hypothetical protein
MAQPEDKIKEELEINLTDARNKRMFEESSMLPPQKTADADKQKALNCTREIYDCEANAQSALNNYIGQHTTPK